MSSVSTLVLLILVTFVHCSCALECYHCTSVSGSYCDDPFNKNHSRVQVVTCSSEQNTCGTGRGTSTWYSTSRSTGVVRACAAALKDKCETVNGVAIPEFGLTDATGTFCVCTGDLCNGRPGSLPGLSSQAVVGRMAMSFTVISLTALAAARFLSQC